MDISEFKVPVPWGHIAVKAWGNKADTPVLSIHGLGDNAGTFDRLLPFLPTSFYYICIDLPSHGKSSPYPPYLFITAMDNVYTLKLLVDYFNRQTYIFMGHSWGGQTAVLFTQLYPESVLKLIVLDSFYLYPLTVDNFKEILTDRIKALIRINKNLLENKPPTYTYEEAVTKLMKSRMWGELYKEPAETLIKRSLIPVENGRFQFSTDARLKAYTNLFCDLRFLRDLVKKYPITCPALFVYASETEAQYAYFTPFIQDLCKYNKNCKIKEVIGNHDVHNNKPELVAPIISTFLTTIKNKL